MTSLPVLSSFSQLPTEDLVSFRPTFELTVLRATQSRPTPSLHFSRHSSHLQHHPNPPTRGIVSHSTPIRPVTQPLPYPCSSSRPTHVSHAFFHLSVRVQYRAYPPHTAAQLWHNHGRHNCGAGSRGGGRRRRRLRARDLSYSPTPPAHAMPAHQSRGRSGGATATKQGHPQPYNAGE